MAMAPASAAKRPTFTPSVPSSRPPRGVKFDAFPCPVASASTTSAATAATFATVKRFWTTAPVRRPVTLSHVSTATTRRATACAVEKENRPTEKRTWASPMPGTKNPSVLAKATETAATKPVLIAKRNVQP